MLARGATPPRALGHRSALSGRPRAASRTAHPYPGPGRRRPHPVPRRGPPSSEERTMSATAPLPASPSPQGARRRPRVVVVGGGFAGMSAVRELRKADVDVLLIDKNGYTTF